MKTYLKAAQAAEYLGFSRNIFFAASKLKIKKWQKYLFRNDQGELLFNMATYKADQIELRAKQRCMDDMRQELISFRDRLVAQRKFSIIMQGIITDMNPSVISNAIYYSNNYELLQKIYNAVSSYLRKETSL